MQYRGVYHGDSQPKYGENIGGGKEISSDETEIENNEDIQRPVDKETQNHPSTQPKTDNGFSIPYWVLIILASTALAAIIIITKKR